MLFRSMLITFLRHADRVKMACLAQLVNVIAPIMTSDTGAWKQTIYYPFLHASNFGQGTVLNTIVKAPTYEAEVGDAPYIDSVVVSNEEKEELVIFAVCKDLTEEMRLTCDLRQYADYVITEHIVMHHDDVKAVNTEAEPNNVVPSNNGNARLDGGTLTAVLSPASWNVIRLSR